MARVPGGRRFLATVLFTDIVGSTELAASLGDRGWRQQVARHNSVVRGLLKRHRGREMDTAGDGFFAVFQTPAEAIACALDIAAEVRAIGLEIRAGVHMGEVEDFGAKVGGMAVNIGARIAALAGPGQVLVSSTVRDLVTGSDIRFGPSGSRHLKGVPGEWQLFEATEVAPPPPVAAAPSELRPRRTVLAAMTAGICAVMATGLVTVTTDTGSASPVRAVANTAGFIDLDADRLTYSVPVGTRPYGALVAAGSVWTANETSNTVSRIDPKLHVVIQTIRVGAGPTALAYADQAVWVANSEDGTLSRIDPATNQVTRTVAVGNGPTSLATEGHWLWVADSRDDAVRRVDATSGKAGRAVAVGGQPAAVTVGLGAVWVANNGDATVSRVDPTSMSVTATIPVGNAPTAIVVSNGAVWVANDADNTVSRIDPAANRVTNVVSVADGPSTLTAAHGSIWVSSRFSGTVSAIDPRSNKVVRNLHVGAAPVGVASDKNGLWVTSLGTQNSAHRGGTLRLASWGGDPRALDPDHDTSDLEAYNLVLTTDGLLAYRRAGGLAGTSIVADLVTSVPLPTDGGRAYTFQLRRGVRYSTGQTVRPIDVRASIERAFRLQAPVAASGMLGNVIGVPQCAQSPARCDLSRGIVVNAAANTVTFRLSKPDPEFLAQLATNDWAVLPAGLSPNRPARGPLPATGPYMVGSITKTQLVFVRNPKFHVFSAAARPDGYPDQITLRLNVPSSADQIAMVRTGKIDLTSVFGNEVSSTSLQELRTRFPSQVHDFDTGSSGYMWLDTASGPFTSVLARRAINYAVDRRHLAQLVFPDTSRSDPTCQVLPPTVAGYAPYCPYTAGGPASTWTKPDLTRARALVAASGTLGQRVTVLKMTDTPSAPASDYVASVLGKLGYHVRVLARTTAKAIPLTMQAASLTGDKRIDAGPWLLGAPYGSAAFFFLDALSCPTAATPAPENFGHFCDAALDRAVAHARTLEVSNPRGAIEAWKAADRLATDSAPWLFGATAGSFDFVSPRVGNYQNQPQDEALLDQIWVR